MNVEDVLSLPLGDKLYLKKWQSNGYYPVEIAERTSFGWTTYNLKGGRKSGECTYTDEAFLYVLQNNLFLIKDAPMSDTSMFNLE